MRCRSTISTLDKLINMSINYNNKLYKLNRETRNTYNTTLAVGQTTAFSKKLIAP
jgi:hypothetical protein